MISMRDGVAPKGEKYYFVIISGHLKDGRGSRHYNQYIICSRLCCGLFMNFYKFVFYASIYILFVFWYVFVTLDYLGVIYHGFMVHCLGWKWLSIVLVAVKYSDVESRCLCTHMSCSISQNKSRYSLKTAMGNRL